MDWEQLKNDVRQGTADPKRVLEALEKGQAATVVADCQKRQIRQLQAQVAQLEERLRPYETPPTPPEPVVDYSLGSEEQRRVDQKRKRKKKQKSPRRGRRTLALKRELVQPGDWEDIYPDDAQPADCIFVRERVAWRLVGEKAVFKGYRLHRRRGQSAAATVPGVLPCSEYGFEFVALLAYLNPRLRLRVKRFFRTRQRSIPTTQPYHMISKPKYPPSTKSRL